MTRRHAQLKANLTVADTSFTDGHTIKMPANPWLYTVEFTPDNRNLQQGLERWYWLCENIGEFRQDWTVITAYNPEENTVYMFKSESDAALFKLTWL